VRVALTTGYVTAQVIVNKAVDLIALADHAAGLLPGGWHAEPGEAVSRNTHVLLRIRLETEEVQPSLRVKPGNKLELNVDNATLHSPRLAFLTYTALERSRQELGMATIHAAGAFSPDGNAILLLGDKGSGKTDTLLALRKAGCLAVGDDLVILRRGNDGVVYLRPGKTTAMVRCSHQDKHYYERKRKVTLRRRGFLKREARLGMVVRLNVHSAVTATWVQMIGLDRTQELLRLHENVGRYISGLPTPLTLTRVAAFCPVLSLDTAETAEFRSRLVSSLLALPFYYLEAATANEAAEGVIGLFKRLKERTEM
jgi:hypothetical protein